MLSLAGELKSRGHELRWVLGPGNVEVVAAAGIEVTVAGLPVRQRLAELARRHPDLWTLPEATRRPVAFSAHFAELAAPAMLEPVRRIVESWQPDVLVHEAAELAGPLAAAAARVPSVCQGFGEVVPEPSVRRAGDCMAPLWQEAGLEPDPYAGCYRGTYVDIYPPTLSSTATAHIPRVQQRRPAAGVPASGNLVYVTFGTVFNEFDESFRSAVGAAAAMADQVLVTIGNAGAPDQVGPMPANVTVERFVPQADVLPRCCAVVCHAGSGTVLASLAHGLPLVCLPRAADQFANATNVARVGAGIAMSTQQVIDRSLRSALNRVLNDEQFQTAAQAIAADIAAMPPDAEVVAAIEGAARS